MALQRQAIVRKNPHWHSSGTSSTMDTSELTSCDRVYAWVQRASALLGWWRKTHNVELTLAKARIYNDTDAFDISKMIAVEEKFLALLKRRVGILADALAVEENWDEGTGHLGNDMMKKIALKIGAHAKDRARGGDFMWNVSATAPWFWKGKAVYKLPSEATENVAELMALIKRWEIIVWSSRGECPGWKSNLLEDMKDAIWLMLKGEFSTSTWTGDEPSRQVKKVQDQLETFMAQKAKREMQQPISKLAKACVNRELNAFDAVLNGRDMLTEKLRSQQFMRQKIARPRTAEGTPNVEREEQRPATERAPDEGYVSKQSEDESETCTSLQRDVDVLHAKFLPADAPEENF